MTSLAKFLSEKMVAVAMVTKVQKMLNSFPTASIRVTNNEPCSVLQIGDDFFLGPRYIGDDFFLGPRYIGDDFFLGPNLVSFNRAVAPLLELSFLTKSQKLISA